SPSLRTRVCLLGRYSKALSCEIRGNFSAGRIVDFARFAHKDLGGHLKTGQRGTPQNRPMNIGQDSISYTVAPVLRQYFFVDERPEGASG
ncbi:MAG TPA: hypothetical protein VK670_16645, partial [Silvibacterium sp.]|nr:hypothetical protein [Silvibacterium sp.]